MFLTLKLKRRLQWANHFGCRDMEIREEDYHMKKRRRTQRYPYLRERKQLIDKRQKQRKYTEKKKENHTK